MKTRTVFFFATFGVAGVAGALGACSSSDNTATNPSTTLDSGGGADTSTADTSTADTSTADAADASCSASPTFGSSDAGACNACMYDKCKTDIAGCYNDCDCIAYADCVNNCQPIFPDAGPDADPDAGPGQPMPDQACLDKCSTAHPSSVAKKNGVDRCFLMSCLLNNGAPTGPCAGP